MLRALDLFCKAGGATKGLQRAGYHVTGVDIAPQPRYCGDRFIQADALTVDLDGYDLIWASPPCQFGSELTPIETKHKHPNLIPPIRERLKAQQVPYIIENVEGSRAHLINPVMLCGTMFDLMVWRHRYFELGNTTVWFLTPPCRHNFRPVLASGRSRVKYDGVRTNGNSITEKLEAMGIDWMSGAELAEAIPPAYSEYLARQLLGVPV